MLCITFLCKIVNWSGGKDSTCSIILLYENHLIDDVEIIYSEVMFSNNVTGENFEHAHFMNKAAAIFKEWGFKVTRVRSDKTYLDIYNHVIRRPRKHMEHAGMRYGFPISKMCSIKRDLKIKPIQEYLSKIGEEYIEYLGIAIDEPRRLAAMHKKNAVSVLEEYGYTQEMARQKCIQYGLLSPSYSISKRGGCWFCPNSKLEELRHVYDNDIETWNRFVSLEKIPNIANDKWNVYGKRLEEIDRFFRSDCEMKEKVSVKKWEMDIIRDWSIEELKNRIWMAVDCDQPIPGCVSIEALRVELLRRGEEPRGYHNT